MEEFRLPHRVRNLAAVEKQLKEELLSKQADLKIVRRNLPPHISLVKTPAFWDVLVAHRRWQHAYEKLKRLRHEDHYDAAY